MNKSLKIAMLIISSLYSFEIYSAKKFTYKRPPFAITSNWAGHHSRGKNRAKDAAIEHKTNHLINLHQTLFSITSDGVKKHENVEAPDVFQENLITLAAKKNLKKPLFATSLRTALVILEELKSAKKK